MIAREGLLIIAAVVVISAVLGVLAWFLSGFWAIFFWIFAGALLLFTLYFFRDPKRTPPEEARDGRLLLAPADGKVVQIEDIEHEPIYVKGPAHQVSIFLSPFNVHVNRAPADGIIEYENYVPGDYLVAWHPKASEKNERSELGMRHGSGTKILFKQIAGAAARRIVYHLKVGDTVSAGQRFGIVKFGSRMDVLVPTDITLSVRKGDRVKAGVTILGRLPEPTAVNMRPERSEEDEEVAEEKEGKKAKDNETEASQDDEGKAPQDDEGKASQDDETKARQKEDLTARESGADTADETVEKNSEQQSS